MKKSPPPPSTWEDKILTSLDSPQFIVYNDNSLFKTHTRIHCLKQILRLTHLQQQKNEKNPA